MAYTEVYGTDTEELPAINEFVQRMVGIMNDLEEQILQKVQEFCDSFEFGSKDTVDQTISGCNEEIFERSVMEEEGMEENKQFLEMEAGKEEAENKGQICKMATSLTEFQVLTQDFDTQAKKYQKRQLTQAENFMKGGKQGHMCILAFQFYIMTKQILFFLQKLLLGKIDWKSFKKKKYMDKKYY